MIKIDITKQLQLAQGYTQLQVNTALQEGAITAIYGPSGAGKTTLLKILAGLTQPEQGTVVINDTIWLDTARRICLPPQQRSIGFVFQDYALFPHMSVLQNLVYAAGKKEDKRYIDELLHLVKMEAFINASPAQLSGGQQQRIALIRALVRKPQLLLLDEPLSALDNTMRRQLRTDLYNIQQKLQVTTVLVSHDIGEIDKLASGIIHLEHGKIVFQGSPQQLFSMDKYKNKLQLTGEIRQIIPNGSAYVIEVSTGSDIIPLTVNKMEIANLNTGDQVMVTVEASALEIIKII